MAFRLFENSSRAGLLIAHNRQMYSNKFIAKNPKNIGPCLLPFIFASGHLSDLLGTFTFARHSHALTKSSMIRLKACCGSKFLTILIFQRRY
jgi:hypothetical protein